MKRKQTDAEIMRDKQKKAEEKKQQEEEEKVRQEMAKKGGDMSYMKQFEELDVGEDEGDDGEDGQEEEKKQAPKEMIQP